jgi:hypothetical protein
MEGNWIKLHRKLLDWEWYDNPTVKVVFIHCLLIANYKDKEWQGVTIKRGQFVASYQSIADRTGLTHKQARNAVNKLVLTGELKRAGSGQGRKPLFTVVSYDDYQEQGQEKGSQRAGKGQQHKKVKKEKNNPPISPLEGESSVSATQYDLKKEEQARIVFDQTTIEQIAMAVNLTVSEMRKAYLYWKDDRIEKHREIDTLDAHRAGFRRYLRNARDKWKANKNPMA